MTSLTLASRQLSSSDGTRSVLALFDAAVRRAPDAVALRHAGRALSYRELDAAVHSRAGALLQLGLAPQAPVALVMATGIDYVVAMLAVLRAGGAYIPLTPALPAARIARMLALADCRLVLLDAEGASACASLDASIVRVTTAALDAAGGGATVAPAYPPDAHLACILFTSGSTGDPKGVRTLHGNLGSYADWSAHFFAHNAGSRVPLTAGPSYAAATSQIYACLCAGGALDILDDALGQADRLLDFYAAHPGHALHTVPTVWRTLLDRLEDGRAGKPAALFLSGEQLPVALIERTFAFDPALPVWNLYGPTESVANISAGRLAPGKPVLIGQAIPGSRLFVVDDAGRALGQGEAGRLLISGPGVCPGYLGDIGRASFFTHTDAQGGSWAVYDTGDMAQRLEDGIALVGRRDGQIKLRGVRIELAELEAHLLRHPGVAQAAVLLAAEPAPGLVAFVQPRADYPLDVAALLRHLRALVPASMLPERWSLQTLPLLPNGKIDRAALRDQAPATATVLGAPADAVAREAGAAERVLASLFAAVLGLARVGLNDDFFALGGNSLKVYDLLARIEKTFGVRLSFAAVYAEPTVEGIAGRLPDSPHDTPGPDAPSMAEPDAAAATWPLSLAQHGLWLHQQMQPRDTSYNLCYRVDFTTPVDVSRVRDAIVQLCARHGLLRCSIRVSGGEPVFRADADAASVIDASAFSVLDLATLPVDERQASLDHALQALADTPFMAEGGLLHRWQCIRVSPERQVLAFVVHHLIFDGVSASLLFDALFALLEARGLPPESGDYSGFVARQARYLDTPACAEDRAFWTHRLAGLASQPAFPVRYRAQEEESAGGRLRVRLACAERARLIDLARREQVSPHVLCLTAFAAMLDGYAPGADFLVAVPFANRLHDDERHAVGYFTALLFHRLQWRSGVPLRALAADLRDDTIASLDHQGLPFPELAALLRKQLRTLPSSTFRLMFGYHDTGAWRAASGRAEEYFNGRVKCDLHLECFDDGDTLEIVLSHRHGAMDAAAARDWLDRYHVLLADFEPWLALSPEQRPALTEAEAARVLQCSRGPQVPQALKRTLPEWFAEAAARHAARPAVWYEGGEISYADLAGRVAALAAQLRADADAQSGPIGICMPHQPALLVALLACAHLGVPYVPLDPSFPPQRIGTIIGQAGVRLLLAGEGSPDFSGCAWSDDVRLHDVRQAAAQPPDAAPGPSGATPDSLLYIIYTSGSTGNPKGVMVPQRGVANYLSWMQQCFDIGADVRILAKTSISFDISTWELLLPLLCGGCVVLASRADTESPEGVARVVAAGGVNVLQFVPSGLSLYAGAGMLARSPGVRRIFCGGEALPAGLVTRVFASGWKGALCNLYGPTEASIFMTFQACDPASPYAGVPIGTPIQNASLYVLDAQGRIQPPNVAGDLYIGGEVLADGYWRDADKTHAAFIDAPPGLPETRLYRTGDQGRLLSDGSFEYLGRDDQQVKIRGYRVELVEIEQHLRAAASIIDVAVFTRHWGENDLRLHAVVVMRDGAAFDAAGCYAYLKAKLPPWMLPATLSCLPALPRLSNGKTDYHLLRELVVRESVQQPPPSAAVSGGVEKLVADAWQTVLGHAGFGLHDSFFEAGGHSMLLLKLRDALCERLGADFTIAELYKLPNVSEQALAYRRKIGAAVSKPVITEIRERISKRKSRQPNRKHIHEYSAK